MIYCGHVTGLFKHEGSYYFYDSNNSGGEYKTDSVEELAKTIASNPFVRHCQGLPIGFLVFSFDDERHNYLSQDECLGEGDENVLNNSFKEILNLFLGQGGIADTSSGRYKQLPQNSRNLI